MILSTATGSLKRLQYDESKNEWVSRFEVFETGSRGFTASASALFDTVAAVGGGIVAVFEADTKAPTTAPTTTPTAEPTNATTGSKEVRTEAK